jgi:hypothetical protein
MLAAELKRQDTVGKGVIEQVVPNDKDVYAE